MQDAGHQDCPGGDAVYDDVPPRGEYPMLGREFRATVADQWVDLDSQ